MSQPDFLPHTGWADRPTNVTPSVAGDLTCEVAVVGGGLGGMAAARRLAELGRDVVLVESDVCGWSASARNAGYVTGTIGSDPRILARFYKKRARGLYLFARNAVTFTEDLIASQEIDCDYEPTGIFSAAATAWGARRMMSNLTSTKRSRVLSAEEAGVPPSFHGGLHVSIGGVLNPGKFALGVRDRVLASGVRVYEGTEVLGVDDAGDSVLVTTPGGRIRAHEVVLATNAFTNRLAVAPRHLSTPVWVTAVETEPITSERLDAAGWTSRWPIVTSHLIMQSFRTTPRGTIVTTTRNLRTSRRPRDNRLPDAAAVADLMQGVRDHFPTLGDVKAARAWGGWIGMTPANLAVAGAVSPRVHYMMACNGHGLPQAPYLGTLLAEHVGGNDMSPDLEAVWRTKPRFALGVVNPVTLRLSWIADRVIDRLDGVRSHRSRRSLKS